MMPALVIGLAIVSISIGVQGFRASGLPLTAEKRLTGRTAHIIGGACIAFGVLLLLALVGFFVMIATDTRP
jgi:hypothetical protein